MQLTGEVDDALGEGDDGGEGGGEESPEQDRARVEDEVHVGEHRHQQEREDAPGLVGGEEKIRMCLNFSRGTLQALETNLNGYPDYSSQK